MKPKTSPSRYLSLILYKTYADLRSESERTYAGFLWWIVEPVLSMLVYYFVFQVVMKRGTENFVAFLFIGVVPWRWFQTTVMHGANAILSEKSLMQQVYLSKLVFPVVSILTDTFKFLIVFAILLLFLFVSGFGLSPAFLALPLVLVTQLLVIVALTLFFSAVTPFFPDVRIMLSNLTRLLFFLSGVFYDVSRYSEEVQSYLRLNPMTVIIQSFRDILLHETWPHVPTLLVISGVSALGCLGGLLLIRRFDYVYPKLRF